MKLVYGAVAALMMFAATAAAQAPAETAPAAPPPPSRCPAIPEAPTLPDGASANSRAMDQGNAAYQSWGTSLQSVLECRRNEVTELRAAAAAANAHASTRVDEYNVGANSLNSVTQNWQAEVEEFNQRNGRR